MWCLREAKLLEKAAKLERLAAPVTISVILNRRVSRLGAVPAEQALRPQPPLAVHLAQPQRPPARVEDRHRPRRMEATGDALPVRQPGRLRRVDLDLRPRGHAAFHRQQAGIESAFAAFGQRLQGFERPQARLADRVARSEEHTYELQSLMRNSY